MGREGSKKRYVAVMFAAAAVLAALAVVSLCAGKYSVSAGETISILGRAIFHKDQTADPMKVNVVLGLRLPRVLASALVGAALSLSGACYQGIFKNPLVSPDFLGVSSGACIGAALAILLGLGAGLISAFAFAGGILAVLISASVAAVMKNRSDIVLVLSGIIVGSLMSSILGFVKFAADPDTQLASITYWTMGSFAYVSAKELSAAALVIIVPAAVLLAMSWWIDVLSLGEEEAKTLGADVKRLRALAIVCATLLTAASVCLAGTIGWVGLVIPHLSRMLIGAGSRRLLPVSCLAGASFMLLVDTLTRTVGAVEMPVSIMTGIIGAPFFLWLLYRRRERML